MTHRLLAVEPAGGPVRTARSGHQAIRDRRRRTIGYELFFRDSPGSVEASDRSTSATLQVLADHAGSSRTTASHLYFVNVTRDFVVGKVPLPDPAQIAVLEVQPDVLADDAVLDGAAQLRARGYGIALDRYLPRQGRRHDQLLRFASHVKLDLAEADDPALDDAASFVRAHSNALLIGTKIGTPERYERARKLGCDLFQGWELDAVQIDNRKLLLGSLAQYVKVLELLAADDNLVDMKQVADEVRRDPDLTMRVLRACNNASVGLRQPLTSVHQAVALLGVKRLRRSVHVGIAQGLAVGGGDRLVGLVEHAMLTGLVAQRLGLAYGSGFLVGLLSQVAEATETPIGDVLQTIPLAGDLADGLRTRTEPWGGVLSVVESYQRSEVPPEGTGASLTLDDLRALHVEAHLDAVGVSGGIGPRAGGAGAGAEEGFTLPPVWTGRASPADDAPVSPPFDEDAVFGPPPTTEQVAEAEAWNAWAQGQARALVRQASVTLDELQPALGLDDDQFRDLQATDGLLVVPIDGRLYAPRWQFTPAGSLLPGLGDVLAAFPGDRLSLAEWLIRPASALGGNLPILLLARGEHEPVVEHVRGMRTW